MFQVIILNQTGSFAHLNGHTWPVVYFCHQFATVSARNRNGDVERMDFKLKDILIVDFKEVANYAFQGSHHNSEAKALYSAIGEYAKVHDFQMITMQIQKAGEPLPKPERLPGVDDAIRHIEKLYPPDSEYSDTAAIGRDLMDDVAGNTVGYKKWRELPDDKLIALAQANIDYHEAN